ncbi:hypothetical protein I302_107417 [Kwoniella bestiolae CBS 10118]|uniref:Uncharacterized protein n=1 Tax=Kwoniella bestiolae CBS 10118 TaxID=1296100 RepID=A0A1B9FYK3_9TREE|nr:hypothetical protein I302_06843 [Kwoniella bestiolae CBS 10118]OCF23858.1 hypothetical protein I302_06843 [Kwoniella bestiolae CBS 10118]
MLRRIKSFLPPSSSTGPTGPDHPTPTSRFLDLSEEIHMNIYRHLPCEYDWYEDKLPDLFNLIVCSRKTYKIYIKFLYRRLHLRYRNPERGLRGMFEGIDWEAEKNEDRRVFWGLKRFCDVPLNDISGYIELIRENVIVNPKSKLEAHVRKFDSLQYACELYIASIQDLESFEDIIRHDNPTTSLLFTPVYRRTPIKFSSVIINDHVMWNVLAGYWDSQVRCRFILPVRLCVHILGGSYPVVRPTDSRRRIRKSIEGWKDINSAVDLILPGWKESVKEVTWHNVKCLEDIKSMPDTQNTSSIYFCCGSHSRYDERSRGDLSLRERADVLNIIFDQLKAAIIKPSSDSEPFELYRIKIRHSHILRFFQLQEFLEYAKGRIGGDERLAEEQDFIKAEWFNGNGEDEDGDLEEWFNGNGGVLESCDLCHQN